MQEITKVFEGKDVRIVESEDQFWFIAKDVCDILGLSNVSKALESLKESNKTTITNSDSGSNYKTRLLVVNEPGLYKLIFKSRKEEAEKFQDWVTEEVLPSIRKTGSYQTPKTRQQLQEELLIATSEEVGQLQQQVQTLEKKVDDQIRLFPSEIDDLYNAVASKSVYLTRQMNHDNHEISEPDFKKEIGLTRRRIWSKLKKRYGVSKYIHIKRKDFDDAISYINNVKWVDLI